MSETTTSKPGIPWWSVLMTATPIVLAAIPLWAWPGSLLGSPVIALICLGTIVVSWWLIGRLTAKHRAAGVIHLIVFTAAMVVMMHACPPLAFIQALYYPYLWEVLRAPRLATIASLAVGIGTALTTLPYDPEFFPLALAMGLAGSAVSIGIGWSAVLSEQKAREREQLYEALQATQQEREELSQMRGIASERERMSRELHDTIAQSLIGAVMLSDRGVRTAEKLTDHVDAEGERTLKKHRQQLELLAESLRDSLAETRALIAETAPVVDKEAGTSFDAALARLVERFRRETSIAISCTSAFGEVVLDRDRQVVLLRIAQEGLSNVRRHSKAEHAELDVAALDDEAGTRVQLRLSDDGVGFAPGAGSAGFGLPGLRERVRALGGTLEIDSAPAAGTRLTVTLPTKDAHV